MRQRTRLLSAIDRRRFMRHIWQGVGTSLALSLVPGRDLFASNRLGTNPFKLGVASGDPTPDGIVLWTRLAPEPVAIGSLGERTIPVGWRVATDSRMRNVVARGVGAAFPQLAHSVHVEVNYNPHIKYYEGDRRGYFAATVTPSQMQLDLRFVTSVEDSSGVGYTGAIVRRSGRRARRPAGIAQAGPSASGSVGEEAAARETGSPIL